jgi:hypothetical protein
MSFSHKFVFSTQVCLIHTRSPQLIVCSILACLDGVHCLALPWQGYMPCPLLVEFVCFALFWQASCPAFIYYACRYPASVARLVFAMFTVPMALDCLPFACLHCPLAVSPLPFCAFCAFWHLSHTQHKLLIVWVRTAVHFCCGSMQRSSNLKGSWYA